MGAGRSWRICGGYPRGCGHWIRTAGHGLGEPPALAFLVAALSGVPSVGIGVALLWLRPHNRIGLLLALAGLIAVGLAAADNYLSVAQQLTTDDAGSLPVSAVAVALLQGSWMLYYLPWAWLLMLFPSGRLVHRTDRWLAAALPAIVVLFSVLAALGAVDSAPQRWHGTD
ncbi:hypothetical protein NHF46_13640 [Arthrobacter alpinus]|nr:hypothetical protein [Arthrobacter alpinus]